MVYAQAGTEVITEHILTIETLAVDLESFAGHAKRSVINVDDVKVVDDLRLLKISCAVDAMTD